MDVGGGGGGALKYPAVIRCFTVGPHAKTAAAPAVAALKYSSLKLAADP